MKGQEQRENVCTVCVLEGLSHRNIVSFPWFLFLFKFRFL